MKNISTNTPATRAYSNWILTLIVLLSITVFTQKAHSQSVYKIMPVSQIKVLGTSNLHDWTMVANSFTCEGKFIIKDGVLQDLSFLNFVLPTTNLKSKEDLMDSRAYKALKTKEFNKITFKLIDAVIVSQQKAISATGNLTIAGITNKITMRCTYVINADGSITCKGSKTIKMRDYGIKAPSFMLGALKTGDEVTIEVLLKLNN